MSKYDQSPTSINSHELPPDEADQVDQMHEALFEAQERLEQFQKVLAEAGGLATAAARKDLAQAA